MNPEYIDLSNHIGLKLSYKLTKLSHCHLQGAVRITQLLRKIIPKPPLRGPCIIKTIHGFCMLINPVEDCGIERIIFSQGTYEEGTLRIMKVILQCGGTFVDVGANIGLMSLYAATILENKGNILSFEPLPNTYKILIENITLNGFRNIEAVNIAIGSTMGKANIYENLNINRGAASLVEQDNITSNIQVPIISLDEYFMEHPNIDRINCIKIDVEGWELEVLKGSRSILSAPNAPVCIIECSDLRPMKGGENRDIYTFMQSINLYRIFRLIRGKEIPSKLQEIFCAEELPSHDNLFCFLPNHIKKLPSHLFT